MISQCGKNGSPVGCLYLGRRFSKEEKVAYMNGDVGFLATLELAKKEFHYLTQEEVWQLLFAE